MTHPARGLAVWQPCHRQSCWRCHANCFFRIFCHSGLPPPNKKYPCNIKAKTLALYDVQLWLSIIYHTYWYRPQKILELNTFEDSINVRDIWCSKWKQVLLKWKPGYGFLSLIFTEGDFCTKGLDQQIPVQLLIINEKLYLFGLSPKRLFPLGLEQVLNQRVLDVGSQK